MEKINDGTTLEEYLVEFLLETYSHTLFLDLCAAIALRRMLGERAMSLTATVPATNTHQQFKDVLQC